MTPLQRVSLQTALASFAAGLGLGLLVPYAAAGVFGDEPVEDPTRNYVERLTELCDLTREQQRILWMIREQQDNDGLKLLRSRTLSEQERDTMKSIARRADERIMQLLQPVQRELFLADLVENRDR